MNRTPNEEDEKRRSLGCTEVVGLLSTRYLFPLVRRGSCLADGRPPCRRGKWALWERLSSLSSG